MNVVLHYLLLLKGTVTALAGLDSLPVMQDALVTHRHVLTAEQLNEAKARQRRSAALVSTMSSRG
jgi:chromate transporter